MAPAHAERAPGWCPKRPKVAVNRTAKVLLVWRLL